MKPETIWRTSSYLHKAGFRRIARALKGLNFVLFHAILPPEMHVPKDIKLLHHGMGTLVASSTVIGDHVVIGHGVLIAETWHEGKLAFTTLADHAFVGSGAMIKPKKGRSITVGEYGMVGAHSVLMSDVPPFHSARPLLSNIVAREGASIRANATSDQLTPINETKVSLAS